jgi:hypothetical protein
MDRIKTPEKTDIILGYLRKYPDTPTQTLAKAIYKKHPGLFKTLEVCRSRVRYYRGSNGDKARTELATSEFLGYQGDLCPFDKIPEGIKHFDEWEPYSIKGEKALRLCDAHVPYHDKEAIETALAWGLRERVDTIIIDDWIDFFAVSFWEKDPNMRNLSNEIETSKQILGVIRDMFPDAEIIWNKGNHEARYDRYMRVKAPELLGVKNFSFEKITGAEEFKIKIIPDKMFCQMGKLNIIHGHEFGRTVFSPVNPARGLFLRAKTHCIAGHWHRTSSHTEKTLTDDVIGCWSVGALCDLRPDYAPINNWNHGAAIIYRSGTKSFQVVNKTIIDGELY